MNGGPRDDMKRLSGGGGVLRIASIHAACGGIDWETHHAAHQFELGMTAADFCPVSAERFLYL